MDAFILLQDYPILVGIGTMEGDFQHYSHPALSYPLFPGESCTSGPLIVLAFIKSFQQLTFQESEGPKQFLFIATEESG